MLYCLEDSYMWQFKNQIVQTIDKLRGKNIFTTCKLLEEFKKHLEEVHQITKLH